MVEGYTMNPEDVKKAYEKAVREGNPLTLIAKELAKRGTEKIIGGDDLTSVKVPDDSLRVGYAGVPLPRDPDWVTDPEGRKVRIVKVTLPPRIVDGLEVEPSKEVNNKVTVERLKCNHCESEKPKKGFELEGKYKFQLQCADCRKYIWLEI